MDSLVQDHIVIDPAVLAGKPVIRGTRLSVEFVIGLLADGWSEPASSPSGSWYPTKKRCSAALR